MITTPRIKNEINFLLPPVGHFPGYNPNGKESTYPPGILPIDYLVKKILGKDGADINELISKGPCSLDIMLTRFEDLQGTELEFPFEIPYDGSVVGKSGLRIFDDDYLYCVETRSGMARKGLACTGFYEPPPEHNPKIPEAVLKILNKDDPDQRETGLGTMFQKNHFNLDFVLKNVNPNPIVVEKPFAPVQITATGNYGGCIAFMSAAPKIVRDEEDVTYDSRVRMDEIMMFKVYLGDEVLVPRRTGPVSIHDDDIERRYRRVSLSEIKRHPPKFCLTLTREEVHCNGWPAYMFPFHYLDAINHRQVLRYTSKIGRFVEKMFAKRTGLAVTANAGVINPTVKGKLVFENITAGMDMERYFAQEEPFALIIPVPYLDNSVYKSDTHNGHDRQKSITL